MPTGGIDDEPTLTVVIPAYNETRILPSTLQHVHAAIAGYAAAGLGAVDVIVVDNASTDDTADVARGCGARVVSEPTQGIGSARNAGAREARSPRLYFLDADVAVPADVLIAVRAALDEGCYGGAVAPLYLPKSKVTRLYCRAWGVWARLFNMTQGVSQFAIRDAFEAVGGYEVDVHMAEDTRFGWRLRKYARRRGGCIRVITNPMVLPSTRRMDQWGPWKTIWRTNPLVTALRRRSSKAWRRWYGNDTVR